MKTDAFQILMQNASMPITKLPKIRQNALGITAKDKLYNAVVLDFQSTKSCFPNSFDEKTIEKYIGSLVNALWYVSGNMHDKINDRSKHTENVKRIPERFLVYDNFNNWREKKQKQPRLSSVELKSHSNCLFQLINKPFAENWTELKDEIEGLAVSLNSYAEFLDNSNLEQQSRQLQFHPPRELHKDIWMDHRKAVDEVKNIYRNIDSALAEVDEMTPVFFDEDIHVDQAFQKSYQRYNFFQNLAVSFDISVVKYCPGASVFNIVCFWKTPADISSAELMTSGIRIVNQLLTKFPEFHTRQLRKEFVQKYGSIGGTKIPPHILRAIYTELTMDATADQNPEVDGRVRLAVISNEPDLVVDLRHLNKGRPNDTFSVFFETLEKEVQSLIAADERRHNVEHVSKYISVRDLIDQTKGKLPLDTQVPSEATVLLAFAPRNSHSNVAKLYKNRIPLRLKVQTRQLRASHIDDHYCAALFKYMRQFAVKFRDIVTFICLDDKSKLGFGEPGQFTSSGVRGKKSVVPVTSVLSCLDHDVQSKGSITPSVYLDVDVPEDVSESFYRGQVTVILKDSIFQPSSPFRHASELQKLLRLRGEKPILMLFSDGGPDHRVTYHAVKLSLIVLFKALNLEMIIACRTAPGHSWANPAERIMSLLNLAFQNAALAREEMTSTLEQVLKSCSFMADIRKKQEKSPELKLNWLESLQPMMSLLENRIERISLKEKTFQCVSAATDEEVNLTESGVSEIDPTI